LSLSTIAAGFCTSFAPRQAVARGIGTALAAQLSMTKLIFPVVR
jgi:hypothetical protein